MDTTEIYIDDSGSTPRQAGDYRLVSGAERVRSEIRLVLNWQRGEVDRHETIGIDYQGILSQKDPDLGLLTSQIRNELLSIEDVVRIESVSAEITGDRNLEIDVTAVLSDSQVLTVTEYVDL